MREEYILAEYKDHWISVERMPYSSKGATSYVVWQTGSTHSVARMYIGKSLGLEYAVKRMKERADAQ